MYAKHRGCSEAMISRYSARGYLVRDAQGRVLVAESDSRLRAALDPGRGGDRSGRGRPGGRLPLVADHAAAEGAPDGAYVAFGEDTGRLDYQREAARDKRASAMQRELDLAVSAGELVPTATVASRIANHVRAALDVLASRRRRLAPKLALEADARKVEQLLEESDREFCLALAGLAAPVAAPEGDSP